MRHDMPTVSRPAAADWHEIGQKLVPNGTNGVGYTAINAPGNDK